MVDLGRPCLVLVFSAFSFLMTLPAKGQEEVVPKHPIHKLESQVLQGRPMGSRACEIDGIAGQLWHGPSAGDRS